MSRIDQVSLVRNKRANSDKKEVGTLGESVGRKAIGIAPNTLLRWMKEPEFEKEYREARRAVHGQLIARLQQAAGAAVSTLLKVMVDEVRGSTGSRSQQQKRYRGAGRNAMLCHASGEVVECGSKSKNLCALVIRSRTSTDLFNRFGFKFAHRVIAYRVVHFDRMAANLAIFHIGLALHRGVQ